MSKHWTKEEVDQLKYLSRKGLTDKEIGYLLGKEQQRISRKRYNDGIKKPYVIDVKEYVAYKGDEFVAVGTIKEIAKETGYTIGTLEYARCPAHHRRAKRNAIKLYRLEDD